MRKINHALLFVCAFSLLTASLPPQALADLSSTLAGNSLNDTFAAVGVTNYKKGYCPTDLSPEEFNPSPENQTTNDIIRGLKIAGATSGVMAVGLCMTFAPACFVGVPLLLLGGRVVESQHEQFKNMEESALLKLLSDESKKLCEQLVPGKDLSDFEYFTCYQLSKNINRDILENDGKVIGEDSPSFTDSDSTKAHQVSLKYEGGEFPIQASDFVTKWSINGEPYNNLTDLANTQAAIRRMGDSNPVCLSEPSTLRQLSSQQYTFEELLHIIVSNSKRYKGYSERMKPYGEKITISSNWEGFTSVATTYNEYLPEYFPTLKYMGYDYRYFQSDELNDAIANVSERVENFSKYSGSQDCGFKSSGIIYPRLLLNKDSFLNSDFYVKYGDVTFQAPVSTITQTEVDREGSITRIISSKTDDASIELEVFSHRIPKKDLFIFDASYIQKEIARVRIVKEGRVAYSCESEAYKKFLEEPVKKEPPANNRDPFFDNL